MANGFTLVEVLIALAVFGLVTAGIVEVADYGFRVWGAQARAISEQADLDATTRVLHGLVTRMDPGSVDEPPHVSGSRSRLAFTTDLPQAASLQHRHADVAIFVSAAHTLLLRWRPHMHTLAGVPPASSDAVLLSGVDDLQFSYLYPDGSNGSGWTDQWSETYLPRLVRIHLGFPQASLRRWPDIIAAPVEDRPRGD